MGEASPCCRSLCRDSSATVLKYSWWGGFSMEGSKWSFTGSQRSPGGPRCHLPSWQADRERDREGRVSRAKWQTRQCDPIHQREGFITVLNALCSRRPETEKRGSEPRLTSVRDPPADQTAAMMHRSGQSSATAGWGGGADKQTDSVIQRMMYGIRQNAAEQTLKGLLATAETFTITHWRIQPIQPLYNLGVIFLDLSLNLFVFGNMIYGDLGTRRRRSRNMSN